ncbi:MULTISPECIES: MBL fold metallo-hydrolase [Nocardia]|uniref:MBL fold metallo-hydrolase n=1 Tax=Nocardia TaxID=1817 RepID=UPI00082F6A1F|nr:MBL fold metallo-hydrolase [Nocardia vaccinii]
MKVHHLNCATFRLPPFRRQLVGHCLLIEMADYLVLVDSGYGLQAIRHSKQVLGLGRFGAALLEHETAVCQLKSLGYTAADVRHVILTHLDFDHAGGIADFPEATVHVHGPEFRAAMTSRRLYDRFRYRQAEWAYGPKWAVNEEGCERWFGFEAVRDLDGLPPEILVVPLFGHTRGHAGVAVDTGHGWLLHAGDSFLAGHEIDPRNPISSALTRTYDLMGTAIRSARQANIRRLIQLNSEQHSNVTIFSSHDPDAYARLSNVRLADQ